MALVCLLLLPEVWGDAARVGMRYDRAALAAGEWWRGFTAHHVHLDWVHAGLNVLGAVLMWALFARDYSAARWLAIWVASCLGVTIGIWCLNPDVGWYVGASGSLHGVMTAGTLAHLRRDDLDSWILAAFIIAKLAYETWAGQLPLAESDNTIAEAHLYGAVGGLVAATFLASRREPVSL
jgi:rhomboid family GlyGly-CTERM serine protease